MLFGSLHAGVIVYECLSSFFPAVLIPSIPFFVSCLNKMDWLHVYISGTAFLVFALVAGVLLVSSKQVKLDMDHGILSYVKFIYSCFLKPHDKQAEGQQDALESFYKTQVRTAETAKAELPILMKTRPASTMPLADVFFVVARTCWVWLPLN